MDEVLKYLYILISTNFYIELFTKQTFQVHSLFPSYITLNTKEIPTADGHFFIIYITKHSKERPSNFPLPYLHNKPQEPS